MQLWVLREGGWVGGELDSHPCTVHVNTHGVAASREPRWGSRSHASPVKTKNTARPAHLGGVGEMAAGPLARQRPHDLWQRGGSLLDVQHQAVHQWLMVQLNQGRLFVQEAVGGMQGEQQLLQQAQVHRGDLREATHDAS